MHQGLKQWWMGQNVYHKNCSCRFRYDMQRYETYCKSSAVQFVMANGRLEIYEYIGIYGIVCMAYASPSFK